MAPISLFCRWSSCFFSGSGKTRGRRGTRIHKVLAEAASEVLEQRVMLSGAPLLRDFTVMSQNLYLGTDLNPIIEALGSGNPQVFIPVVSVGWQQVVDSNFEERAGRLADQIQASDPTVIGLQEVALWQTGEAFHPDIATEVEFDFLAILLEELSERDLSYTAVAVAENFSAEVPGLTNLADPNSLRDIRLTDRDVILVRSDLKTSDLKILDAQAENFETNLVFDLPALGTSIELTRGWTSVDVQIRGKEFRVVNTHLELEVPVVGSFFQEAQALELIAGPLDTDLPVIALGDFNSRADQSGAVYELLTGVGFEDMWTITHPGEEGFTCCHDADLRNETVDFQEGRIDWILYRGDFLPLEMDLFGEELADRTASGLWPSDHAGLVASLIVSPLPPVVRNFAGGELPPTEISDVKVTGAAPVLGIPAKGPGGRVADAVHPLDRREKSIDLVFQHWPGDNDFLSQIEREEIRAFGRALASSLANG